jgi:CheY-like chemotaxis protein
MATKLTPINILLADDDKDDRFFFEKALKGITIPNQLKTVPDGERLMEHLIKNAKELPDVLFLDINMPRKTGAECLVEIKAHKKLNGLIVIMYSTSVSEKMADTFYENGAHFYLHKCEFAVLREWLQKILEMLKENSDRPSRDKFILN